MFGALTRRSLLRTSVGFAAAGALARPYIANAAASTATVLWIQGFAEEEDISFKKIAGDYEKASGNTLDYTILPYAPMRQKLVAALTSGAVPDLFQSSPYEAIALYAWENKLADVSDVVETQRAEFTETALVTVNCYNGVEKKRAFYGVPYNQSALPNHVWRPLVEKAGYKMEDIPKTWDAFYDFFKEVQTRSRATGNRKLYGMGLTLSTTGNDTNNQFEYFLMANGAAQGLVTKDGKLHVDDPAVRGGLIKALTYVSTAYKDGFIPPSAITWNDSDNNNAFHAKQVVMDLDGSISTEVAIIKNKQDYDDIITMGMPLGNDGKPLTSFTNNSCALIPKGAKNIDVAKDFLKYFIQPKVLNEYLKTGLGRYLPPMQSMLKDPWWQADPHRDAFIKQGLLGPTAPALWVYNPAYAQVRNEHVWGTARLDVIQGGMTPEAAADKALKRISEVFAKFPIG